MTTLAPSARNFFVAVLGKLGLPVTETNLDALYSVTTLEGPNMRYNPLNVIQPEPGSRAFNSVGVQTYPDFQTGVKGTVTLLRGSHWDRVRAAMADPNASIGSVLGAWQAAYTWDPGVHFPTGANVWNTESRKAVGAAGPTGRLAKYIESNPAPGSPGAGAGGSGEGVGIGAGINIPPITGNAGGGFSWSELLPWNWGQGISSAASGLLEPIISFLTKAAFIGAGLILVVLGLYKAAGSPRAPIGVPA